MGLQRPMVMPDGRASTAHGASGKAGQGWMGQVRGGSSNQAAWLSHLAWILVCQGPLGDAPSLEGVSLRAGAREYGDMVAFGEYGSGESTGGASEGTAIHDLCMTTMPLRG
jgi:hypothetical protein